MTDPFKTFGVALARVGYRHGLKTATRAPAFMARIEQEIRGLGRERAQRASDDLARELERWLRDNFEVQDGSGEHHDPTGTARR